MIPMRWRDGDANIVQIETKLPEAAISGAKRKSGRSQRRLGNVHVHIIRRRSGEAVVGFVTPAVCVSIGNVVMGGVIESRGAYFTHCVVTDPNVETLSLVVVGVAALVVIGNLVDIGHPAYLRHCLHPAVGSLMGPGVDDVRVGIRA